MNVEPGCLVAGPGVNRGTAFDVSRPVVSAGSRILLLFSTFQQAT